jgi:hypothetical protein
MCWPTRSSAPTAATCCYSARFRTRSATFVAALVVSAALVLGSCTRPPSGPGSPGGGGDGAAATTTTARAGPIYRAGWLSGCWPVEGDDYLWGFEILITDASKNHERVEVISFTADMTGSSSGVLREYRGQVLETWPAWDVGGTCSIYYER